MTKSWDFWDTLVTRAVLHPHDVFELVEMQSGVDGFARERIAAEARSRIGVTETNLSRIYEFLPYRPDQSTYLKSLEFEAELALASPVGANASRFMESDLVISDMYLDRDAMLKIARKCALEVRPEHMLVSSEFNATKHDGGLFDLASALRTVAEHEGDNLRSDVQVPTSKGIASKHFRDISPSDLEKSWGDQPGDARYIAGVIRAARLANIRGHSAEEWNIYAQIVAPVLVQFVEWIFSDATSRGIRKLFFLARDGQILFRIAKKLCESRNLEFECCYLYASRQAFHLPGHRTIEESESWLLDDTSSLTLRMVAARAGVECSAFAKIASRYFEVGADDNLSTEQRSLLPLIIRTQDFADLFDSASDTAYDLAYAYFSQEGVIAEDYGDIAIIDVGWNARLQRSLENILAKSGSSAVNVHGYYLGIAKTCVYRTGDRVHGFVLDPFEPAKEYEGWLDRYRAVIEFFLSADHPSVHSYARGDDQRIGPQFIRSVTESELRDIQYQQAAIMAYATSYAAVSGFLGRALDFDDQIAINKLRDFLERPSRAQAEVFVKYSITEQQVESDFVPLVRKLRFTDRLRSRHYRIYGMWPEGSHALTGSLWFFNLRRSLASIKRSLLARVH